MIGPLTLPDWLPWWMAVAIIVPGVLFLLAFVLMPFSVLGVKGRLDLIEARLDEIQGEIRALVLRLPESPATQAPIPPAYDRAMHDRAPARGREPDLDLDDDPPVIDRRRTPPGRPSRSEPRLDWPR